MPRGLRVAAVICAAVVVYAACGPAENPADLTVTAKPRTIDNHGGKSTITLTATDGQGKPGTGTVRVSSAAGDLVAGQELTLAEGTATVDFSCVVATDPSCTGTIAITGEWVVKGKLVSGNTTVTVVTPDAGPPDAGPPDAGPSLPDAGSFDGGTYGVYRLSLAFEKNALIKGTGDRMLLTATLTETTTSTAVADAGVTFTTTGGSFASTAGTLTTTAATDATGVATATVYVTDAMANFRVTAAAFDATAYGTVVVSNVNTLQWVDTTMSRVITVASTGRNNSIPVQFKVLDSASQPVPNIAVNFRIKPGSASGGQVTPTAVSNTMGIAQATLSSGESVGSITVEAVVSGTEVPGMPTSGIRGESGSYTVIVGRPSDGRLNVTCTRKSLGALETATPPLDLTTDCAATVIDRNGAGVPFPVTVQWLTEQGSATPNSGSQDMSNTAHTTFHTGGGLPLAVTPFAGEPSNGANNPRDMFVTIIAAVGNGEEEFWDGSGGGVTNGKWDPGEWFVDLPEPFVDSNDNQRYDPGEPFIDTDRIDCANPAAPPTRNGQWDGPNGCWDSNITIWRSAHVVYTGALASFGTVSNPATAPLLVFAPAPPASILPNQLASFGYQWFDAYFNRLSSDSAAVTAQTVVGTRGQVSVTSTVGGESFGHDLVYETVRATESGPGTGAFSIDGPCDSSIPDAGYPLTRCLRQYRFAAWQTGPIGGTVTVTAPAAQSPLSDGGIPPPTTTTFELRATNSLQAGPSTYRFDVSFQ